MKRPARLLLAALAVLAVACNRGGDSKDGSWGGSKGEAEGGESAEEKVPVRVSRAERANLERTIEATAILEADRTFEVHSDVSGRVESLHFRVGERVDAGKPFAQLSDPDLAQRRIEAALALEKRRAEHAKSLVRLDEIEADIERTRIDLDELEKKEIAFTTQLARDREKVENMKRLLDRKEIKKDEYTGAVDTAERTARELATSVFEKKRKKLALENLLSTELSKATLEIDAANLAVKTEEGAIARIETELARMTIVAKVTGVVQASDIVLGQWVTKERALAAIAMDEFLVVRVRLPEREIPLVRADQKVAITSPTLSETGLAARGIVEHVSRFVDPASGTVEVRVRVEERPEALRPGMLVRCEVEVAHRVDTIVIPRRAIFHEEGQDFLFRIEDGKAVRVEVRLGIARENRVEALGGVTPGDQVVTVGAKTLENGTAVTVVEE